MIARLFAAALGLVAAVAVAHAAYVERPATYPWPQVPFVMPVLGDGSTPSGGIPPAKDLRARPSAFDTSLWMVPTTPSPLPGTPKFRSHCNASHLGYDDPIVYPGQKGASHLHQFWGNTGTDYKSTYTSLRTTGGATCGGGILNRSAYWTPTMLKDNALGDGKTMVVKPDFAVVYYITWPGRTAEFTRFSRGFRMVFGVNPSDPGDSKAHAEVDAFINPNGFPLYVYLTNGFVGWQCDGAGTPVPSLATADGTPALNCPATSRLTASVRSPGCWDGTNLTSPDGRSHVRHAIGEPNTGRQDVCPSGWYRIPQFSMDIYYSHQGPDDYRHWYLSSDRHGGHTYLNGQSMHADWFGAWDWPTMTKWMRNCTGITFGGIPGNPHECGDSAFGDGNKGIVGEPAPDGSRNPQLDLGTRWADHGDARFEALPVQ